MHISTTDSSPSLKVSFKNNKHVILRIGIQGLAYSKYKFLSSYSILLRSNSFPLQAKLKVVRLTRYRPMLYMNLKTLSTKTLF